MIYKNMGETSEKISAIGLGTWAFGGDYWGKIEDRDSIKTIETAIDNGVNLIDTAPSYGFGHSEEVVGKAISKKRDKVFVTTKCGTVRKDGRFLRDLRPESIRREIETSLRRLGTDYVDLYLLHWPDINTPIEDTIEEIKRIKKSGKIRYFGLSNYDKNTMAKVQELIRVDCYEPQNSIIHSEKEIEISFANKIGAGCISYGSLAGGILSGKYKEIPVFDKNDKRSVFYPYFEEPLFSKVQDLLNKLIKISEKYNKSISQIVLNHTFSDYRITSAITGAKTPEQILENIMATEFKLSSEDLESMNMLKSSF